jgi:hypothetical protein
MQRRGVESTGDAAQVRRCLAAATKQITKALAYAQPQATTAADFVKMRALRQELSEQLAAFDERHGLRGNWA